jgi:hypothetical protein
MGGGADGRARIRQIALDELGLDDAEVERLDDYVDALGEWKSRAEAVAGEPRVLDAEEIRAEARVEGGARAAIFGRRMLDAPAVGEALGSQAAGNPRQLASRLRASGRLLGVPRGKSWVYPRFQLDLARGRIRPVAAEVNRLLGAAHDPWGVASWWVTPKERLANLAPCDVLGTSAEGELAALATTEREEIG